MTRKGISIRAADEATLGIESIPAKRKRQTYILTSKNEPKLK